MKLSTLLTITSAAVASSRTVSVPDVRIDDVDDLSIADAEMPPGEKVPGQNPFNLCKGDHGDDALKITQVDLNPHPVKKGYDLTVAVTGNVNKQVEQGALVDVKIKFLATVVWHQKLDICGEMEKLGQSCPVAPGQLSFNHTFPIPKKGVPGGTFHLSALATLPDDSAITCFEGKVKVA